MNGTELLSEIDLLRVVNERGAARHIGASPSSLKKWRKEGRGPKYFRVGTNKCVRYRVADLEEFLQARAVVPREAGRSRKTRDTSVQPAPADEDVGL